MKHVILFSILLLRGGLGRNVFQHLQSHVETAGQQGASGQSRMTDSDSPEINFPEVQANLGETHNAPASLKGSSKTVLPIEFLEFVASWFHPAPPHHHGKQTNKSAIINNLQNETFINELANNKTLLLTYTQKADKVVVPSADYGVSGLRTVLNHPGKMQQTAGKEAQQRSNTTAD